MKSMALCLSFICALSIGLSGCKEETKSLDEMSDDEVRAAIQKEIDSQSGTTPTEKENKPDSAPPAPPAQKASAENEKIYQDIGLSETHIAQLKAIKKRIILPRAKSLEWEMESFTLTDTPGNFPGSGISLDMKYHDPEGGKLDITCSSSGVGSLPVEDQSKIQTVSVEKLGSFELLPFQGTIGVLILDEIQSGGLYCSMFLENTSMRYSKEVVKTLVDVPLG